MIQDDKYWQNREKNAISQTIEILTDDFAIDISMADKLLINHYAKDFFNSWKTIPTMTRMNIGVSIPAELAARFAIVYCNFNNLREMHEAIYHGKPVSQ